MNFTQNRINLYRFLPFSCFYPFKKNLYAGNHLEPLIQQKANKTLNFCVDRLSFSLRFKRGVRHFALQLLRGASCICLFFKIL
jgi:hypothetical protein